MQTLRVNIFNTSSNLTLLAAQEAGCFARRGLTLEIQHTPNSDAQRSGLAEGRFEIAHAAVDNAVAMVEAGQDVVIVLGGDAGMNEFMVRSEIQTIADLRGKVLAVDAPNTAFALVAKKILKNHGLLESRDYSVRLAGGTGPRAAAMVADPQLAAAMINPPFSFTVRQQGLKSLGNQYTLLGPYQATGAFVLRSWARDHADLLQDYLTAYIEGQRLVMDPVNRNQMIELLARSFKLDSAAASGTYEALLTPGAGLAPDARFNAEGFQAVLAIRAEMEGMWGGTPPAPARFIDLSYAERATLKIS
ncbi:MAG: ABC transporter substrate-binding protein [Hylemonella sp.]|nr:ABC transporter substrate-binding protein [Hylemonella sp.]